MKSGCLRRPAADFIDSTDFVPTFAELAGARLPANNILGGHSIRPGLRSETGKPSDRIFIELARQWWRK